MSWFPVCVLRSLVWVAVVSPLLVTSTLARRVNQAGLDMAWPPADETAQLKDGASAAGLASGGLDEDASRGNSPAVFARAVIAKALVAAPTASGSQTGLQPDIQNVSTAADIDPDKKKS